MTADCDCDDFTWRKKKLISGDQRADDNSDDDINALEARVRDVYDKKERERVVANKDSMMFLLRDNDN